MQLNKSMQNIKRWKGIFERLNGGLPEEFIDVRLDFENFELVVGLPFREGCVPGFYHIPVPEFKEIEEDFRVNHTMDQEQWKFFLKESLRSDGRFAFWVCWLSL